MPRKPKAEGWQDAFRSACLQAGFRLSLSRPMCEFLSAVADNVAWDRSVYGSSQAFPDNFLVTARALMKRGLIDRKPAEERIAHMEQLVSGQFELWNWNAFDLTPAGAAVVELLKLAGLFIEADAAINKKDKANG